MTAKRQKQLTRLAIVINAIIAAELVVYFGSVLLIPPSSGAFSFAFLTIFMIVTGTGALANLIVLTPLVTRGKAIKRGHHRVALALLGVSLLYLAFVLPLAGAAISGGHA
jgi:hypothetical protein